MKVKKKNLNFFLSIITAAMKMQVKYSDLSTNYQPESYFALIYTVLKFSTQPSAIDLLYFARINTME